MTKLISVLVLAMTLGTASMSHAEETTLEKAQTVGNESVDGVKKGYRKAKNKACETINGKLECAGKKVKNGAKNLGDKAETTAEEVENKVD